MNEQSMDSDDMRPSDMIINEADGLPNLHLNYSELDLQSPEPTLKKSLQELIDDEDLPTSLIVTNLDSSVFTNEEAKNKITMLFAQFGEPTSIQFFRSFKRMRVNYSCPAAAAKTRINLHQANFGDKQINCYFAQPVSPIDLEDQHLQPPAPTKQFLISPPASPPVGWEPRDEAEPLVNYDLLAAIANLTPGEAHELHPPQGSQPGIVVHVCEEQHAAAGANEHQSPPAKVRIPQTRCPQHR